MLKAYLNTQQLFYKHPVHCARETHAFRLLFFLGYFHCFFWRNISQSSQEVILENKWGNAQALSKASLLAIKSPLPEAKGTSGKAWKVRLS